MNFGLLKCVFQSIALPADGTFKIDFVKVEFQKNTHLCYIFGQIKANNKDSWEILCLLDYIFIFYSGNYLLRKGKHCWLWLACFLASPTKIARLKKSCFDQQLSLSELRFSLGLVRISVQSDSAADPSVIFEGVLIQSNKCKES